MHLTFVQIWVRQSSWLRYWCKAMCSLTPHQQVCSLLYAFNAYIYCELLVSITLALLPLRIMLRAQLGHKKPLLQLVHTQVHTQEHVSEMRSIEEAITADAKVCCCLQQLGRINTA